MPSRSEIIVLGRRLHNALRHAIEDADPQLWSKANRKDFEHYACSMYLAGTLAFIEGKYGERSWTTAVGFRDIDEFLRTPGDARRPRLASAGVSAAGLEALVCIRNAITHNDSDLSKNRDKDSLAKVSAASLPGVLLRGTNVELYSNTQQDFMEYVRKCFIAVSMLHGHL